MPIQIPTVQTGLEASIQAAAQKAGRNLKINLGANSRSIDALAQPLGRITGKADEFTKSMEAANARVLAFGASVGVLSAITRGFRELVKTTVEVEKSLANINSILNVSAANLDKFKKQIFDVARNTEQTFDTVAQAALELSRQGLKAEEVTKRLNDSMILARLSGLGAAEAVSGLTAAINSFNSQGLTSAEVLNKIAAAAVKAAVSEKDLIEGIKRSGAVAIEAGVTFDELVGVISALQQQTARGGSVIGNSLKTIFTRLQSLEKLKTMQDLGVEITNAAGEVLPATKLIQNLGQAIQSLPDTRKLQIAENLVGKFQIAPFLAILRDYNSETQIAIDITRVAANATTEAYGRNVTLNKTLSAAINEATTNLKELANTLGEIGVTESLQNVLGFFNSLVSKIQEVLEGEGIGSEFARGLVKGIGNVISGPGLAIFGAIIAKLTIDLTRFGAASLQTFFGLNKTAKDIAATQGSIASTLLKNSDIQKQILAIENSTLSVEQKRAAQTQFFTQALNSQLAIMKQMQGIAASIAPSVVARTGGRSGGRGRAAGGFIPNFDAVRGYGSERQDIMRGVGGAPSSARPVTIPNFNFGSGQRGTMIANSSEFIVPNYAGGGSAIYNQDMVRSMGMPAGARSLAAGGYIPNFARGIPQARVGRPSGTVSDYISARGSEVHTRESLLKAGFSKQQVGQAGFPAAPVAAAASSKTAKTAQTAGPRIIDIQTALGRRNKLPTLLTPAGSGMKGFLTTETDISDLFAKPKNTVRGIFAWEKRTLAKGSPLRDRYQKRFNKERVKKWAEKQVIPMARQIAETVGAQPVDPTTIEKVKETKGYIGGIHAAFGAIFDAAVATGLKLEAQDPDRGDFDYRGSIEKAPDHKKFMTKLFGRGFAGQGFFNGLADLKFSGGASAKTSMAGKTKKEIRTGGALAALRQKIFPTKSGGGKSAAGYIPNFDATRGYGALDDAVMREQAAGLPLNQIRINQDARLRNAGNPMGLAVTNVRDEPTGSIAAARGYVPSYAKSPAGGADALNKGFDNTLNKLFMFQIAMGVLTGFTSELSDQNKTVANSMKALNLAITTLMISSMTKGGIGGLGSFLMGGGSTARNLMRSGRTQMAGPNMFHGLDIRKAQGLPPAQGLGARAVGVGKFGAGAALAAVGPAILAVAAGQIFRMFQQPSVEAGKALTALSVTAGELGSTLDTLEQQLTSSRAGGVSGGMGSSVGDFIANAGTSLFQTVIGSGVGRMAQDLMRDPRVREAAQDRGFVTRTAAELADPRIQTQLTREADGKLRQTTLKGLTSEQFAQAETAFKQSFLAANPRLRALNLEEGESLADTPPELRTGPVIADPEARVAAAEREFEDMFMTDDLFTDQDVLLLKTMISGFKELAETRKGINTVKQEGNLIDKITMQMSKDRLQIAVDIKNAQENQATAIQKRIQQAKILGNVGKRDLSRLEDANKVEQSRIKFVQQQRKAILGIIKSSGNLISDRKQEAAVMEVLNGLTFEQLNKQDAVTAAIKEALKMTDAVEIGEEKLTALGETKGKQQSLLIQGALKLQQIEEQGIINDGNRTRGLQDRVDKAAQLADELERAARADAFETSFALSQAGDASGLARAAISARRTGGSRIAGQQRDLDLLRFDRNDAALQAANAREGLRGVARGAGTTALEPFRNAVPKGLITAFEEQIKLAKSSEDLNKVLKGLKASMAVFFKFIKMGEKEIAAFNLIIDETTKNIDNQNRDIERELKLRLEQSNLSEKEIKQQLELIGIYGRLGNAIENIPQKIEDLQFRAATDPNRGSRQQAKDTAEAIQNILAKTRGFSGQTNIGSKEFSEKLGNMDPLARSELLQSMARAEQGIGFSVEQMLKHRPNEDLELINHELRMSIVGLTTEMERATSNAEKARIAFDLQTQQKQLDAGKAILDRGGTAAEATAAMTAIRGQRVNRGLGQTFAESSILNATDEERAQRVNELLRDGSVQFANNIGTAMHKAIRDGESFSDGLRSAGLAFLDYISEAMMQMAAQQVVGQFTSGMFGSGGTSQTGGASAGGGGGFFSKFSGGGGGGGNVTGAAVVGGNFSSGGLIIGGSGRRDDVPAMLTGGEFVMNRAAVADYGINFMKQLNERRVQGFANGGAVGGRDLFDPAFSGRALRGKGQLMGFARQGVTSGAGDFIRGGSGGGGAFGAVALQPGSIRGTQFQRRTDLMSQKRTEARRNALNLYFQQLESEDQRQKAWDAEQERLLKERLFRAEQERKARAAEKARREAEKKAKKAAIWSTVGMVIGGMFGGPIGAAAGSAIGGAVGGSATGGYIRGGKFSSEMIEPSGRGRFGGRGGPVGQNAGVDTVPTMLTGGEFVMNAAATRRIGRGNLADLNSGVGGAGGGSSSALIGAIGQLVGAQSRGDSGNNISITINQDGTQSTSMGGNTSQSAQSLASRIRDAVTEIIAEEKRLGGVLRTA